MESFGEYNPLVNSDHNEKSDMINIVDVPMITNDPMWILEESTSQEFQTLQPPPPSYTDLETMSFIEAPIVNQDFRSSNDASNNFLILDQDIQVDAVNQQPVVLTDLGTPAVDNADQIIIILSSVTNPLSTESFQHAIPVINSTINQELSGNITLGAQSTTNQENVSGVAEQVTTNPQVMKNNSLVAQNTTNRQVIENATSVDNTSNNDQNMASTSKPPTPKKRGRKPKYPEGRRPRSRKVKLYEMSAFDDPNRERRRLNAINARRHRALAKEKLEQSEKMLQKVTEERDSLRKEVEKYKKLEEALLKQLEELQNWDC